MNRRIFGSVLIAALGFASIADAGKDEVFTDLVPGVGAGGYDVVAYQSENAARQGNAAIAVEHAGVTYRFGSEANRDAFVAATEKYLPRFGGYCAWAVSQGYTAKGDPEAWSVVGGKLYLNYSRAVRSRWSRNASGNIAKGEANWPRVLE